MLKTRHVNVNLACMNSTSGAAWYAQLAKPFFAPPAFVFGPVWTVLYVVIAISFGFVLWQYLKRRLPFGVLLPFILNLLFNVAYTPIQFGLKNNALASVDVLLVLVTLLWAMAVIWRRARWVVYANLPYLLWVTFATMLQFSITWLNR
ncbi:TspO/MBR family protein [Polaromonas sp.]|uniref:TspO/MBR family protein n=1 Tax=Polaromonas sp. TaxID=1869339 RepID=UPI0027345A64|nr:TspO/MBR family protein [Polaromonas sp.]